MQIYVYTDPTGDLFCYDSPQTNLGYEDTLYQQIVGEPTAEPITGHGNTPAIKVGDVVAINQYKTPFKCTAVLWSCS